MKLHSALLYALAVSLFALAVSGCETPRQRQMVLASFRVEAGTSDGELNRGKRDWGMDSNWIGFSFAPFAGLEPPREVYVLATHAAHPEEPEQPKPSVPICPHGIGSR
jgi:hypothetical protein